MRLFIVSERDRFGTVLYLENLTRDLERRGHFLYGTGRLQYTKKGGRSLTDALNNEGPFDGILVVGFKRKSFLRPLADIDLPKAIILDDYYPTKRFIKDANKRLDADRYDMIFVQTRPELRYLREQKRPERPFYLPMSVDLKYFNRRRERDIDVAGLWGRNPKYYPTRQSIHELIDALGRNGFKTFTGRVFFEHYATTLNRTKIFVNGRTKYDNIQSRFSEVAASGCLMITEPNEDLDFQGFKHGENIITFQGLDSLEILIRAYMINAERRERIAAAGYNLIKERHTNEIRIREIEEAMSLI